MKVLVIGAAGMVGRKLVAALLATGRLGDRSITGLALADVVTPSAPASDIAISTVAVDLSDPDVAARLVADRPDVIFHLAAIVSGEAEADFEKGYRINLDGTRYLLEAIRLAGQGAAYCPRLVFTSSIAVFGEPLPAVIGDTHEHTPLTSYGVQKAICELLLADYSRRGFVDGVGIRLPTIAVRPGKPNKAASALFLRHHPRAPGGAGGPAAGGRYGTALVCQPPGCGRLSAACRSHGYGPPGQSAQSHHARPCRHRCRADRGAGARCRPKGHRADPPAARRDHCPHRRPAGRRPSMPAGPGRSALSEKPASTRSSAFTLPMNWAAASAPSRRINPPGTAAKEPAVVQRPRMQIENGGSAQMLVEIVCALIICAHAIWKRAVLWTPPTLPSPISYMRSPRRFAVVSKTMRSGTT